MKGAVFLPCCLTWDQTMVEVIKIIMASFKRSPACAAALSAPNPAACHHQLTPPPKTPGHSQASLGQSLVRLFLLSPGSWCAQGFVCALQESVSPVLLKFWLLYGGVNGDLFQRGLCHIQVCPTESLCSWGRPLMTWASTRDTQTLKGRSGSISVGSCGAHKVSFESSECLWGVWGLILKTSPFLILSCWGFSFVLRHGVSFSAAGYYFGVLTGDEHKSFYSAILWVWRLWMNHDLHLL